MVVARPHQGFLRDLGRGKGIAGNKNFRRSLEKLIQGFEKVRLFGLGPDLLNCPKKSSLELSHAARFRVLQFL